MATPSPSDSSAESRSTSGATAANRRPATSPSVGKTLTAREPSAAEVSERDLLRESEARYRTLFELCPAGVYSCDIAGVIQSFNYHATLLWGRSPTPGDTDERFCGAFKLFLPDGTFVPHEESLMAEVLSGHIADVHDAEVVIERPDGSQVTVVVNIRPLRDQSGHRVGAVNCFYDVSERKRAESKLADSLSGERSTAEFRELFIGILGHDLRNPLGAIAMAAAFLIRRGLLDEADRRTVARIVRSSQRMSRMITQMLDLTRARLGGGLSINPAPSDLREICQDVAEEFGASIHLDVEGDMTGTWDKDRLEEVISNLAGNAVEYSTPGTLVGVKARAEDSMVVVEVANRGEPIPADVLPFIFEPFRRAKQGDRSAAGNLGLGLYIAWQIVFSHGGTLEARSAGGTTTFVMRLPRSAVHEAR
jgi:signal transduction histidine kinase